MRWTNYLIVFLFFVFTSTATGFAQETEALGWPRMFESGGNKVVVHQPQLDEWDKYELIRGKAAVAVTLKGDEKEYYGVLDLETTTETDFDSRTVLFKDFRITDVYFPTIEEKLADKCGKAVRKLLPKDKTLIVALDRVIAGLEKTKKEAKGVPMGGDLSNAPEGKAPSFLVAAMKDPYSGNLDRIQIVKGWLDAKGKTHEKVYDVVWSDNRKPGKDGKLPLVGNTVDVENATWTNTIGAPELITVWTDPDFDSKQSAFYYSRVIEIPTPRWTAYDAKRFNIKMDKEVPMSTQERAYTSPIWYTP